MAWICFRAGTCASMVLRKRMNSWCRWRCILRPMMVPRQVLAMRAFEDVEGREQCRRAMTLVVVGHRPGAALLHWQAGLGAVERLDLALFIDREDDGMGGRINIETDDVAQLVDEARVGGEFELFHPVRLQAVRAPDSLDGTRADADDLRHHGGGPVGRLGGRGSLG